MRREACNVVSIVTMVHLPIIYIGVAVLVAVGTAQLVTSPDGLCSTLVSTYHKYHCDEFVVQTDDGFLLGVQRLYLSPRRSLKGPLFLLHGLLLGGDIWVLNPPSEGLAFVLADAGYDVWIGNIRTTTFSYGHVYLQRNDKEFWNWSVDELAEKDLPCMLHLVVSSTNKKVHFLGFSQGSQAAFAAFSEGQLLDIVDKIIMVAPVAYLTHGTPIINAAEKIFLDKVFELLDIYEFTTKTMQGREYVDKICTDSNLNCYKDWITVFTGPICCVNLTRKPFYDKYETQSTSVKNMAHLAQQIRHGGNFAKFDYGPVKNLQLYGQATPPPYDVSVIPTNRMLLIQGERDALSNVQDVEHLKEELKIGFQWRLIPIYGHIDFALGSNAKDVVYEEIITFLET